MSLENSIAKAKRDMAGIEGTRMYITDKGRIRKSRPESWENLSFTVFVKKGITYVKDEKGQQIQPREAKGEGKAKGRNVPDLRKVTDALSNKDIQHKGSDIPIEKS